MDGQLLADAFVELTDTMVADFDVIEFQQVPTDRSVQLLDVSAAGTVVRCHGHGLGALGPTETRGASAVVSPSRRMSRPRSSSAAPS
jgi:hypothetical protein